MKGIEVHGLKKSYRSRGDTRAVLRGVDLVVRPGEVVGLIGPNGAGKTTLLSCIAGFLNPDAGRVAIDGQANDDLDIRRRTGFVPERVNFGRDLTGFAFLRYMARLAEVPEGKVRVRIDGLLARHGLSDAAGRRLSAYSRGMLQRIAMCQALLAEPDFLFLDEPTSALDPHGVFLIREVIAEQRQRGAAILLNSHQLAEVEKVCDRVVFLRDGVIARDERLRGAARIDIEIRLLPGSFDRKSLAAVAGVEPIDDVLTCAIADDRATAELVARVAATGAGVIDVRRKAVDLESIFRGADRGAARGAA